MFLNRIDAGLLARLRVTPIIQPKTLAWPRPGVESRANASASRERQMKMAKEATQTATKLKLDAPEALQAWSR